MHVVVVVGLLAAEVRRRTWLASNDDICHVWLKLNIFIIVNLFHINFEIVSNNKDRADAVRPWLIQSEPIQRQAAALAGESPCSLVLPAKDVLHGSGNK